jgi:putative SOS response-associated peptidase YedK
MCGRFTLTAGAQALADEFELADVPQLAPRYNIAPSQDVASVRMNRSGERRVLRTVRWGLIPHWAKDPAVGNRMINARAESAAEKPAYRTPFRKRRCLVPATGFFEWKRVGISKQPMLMRLRSGGPFAFAGLWDRWQPPEGEPVDSCTILTTTPNDLVAPIHNRMPVILPPEAYAPWLDPGLQKPSELASLLAPYDASEMLVHPVSRRVNSPAHDDEDCIEPVEPDIGGLFKGRFKIPDAGLSARCI